MDRSNRSIKLVLLERMQKWHPETDQSTAPEKRACLSSLLICEGSALSRTGTDLLLFVRRNWIDHWRQTLNIVFFNQFFYLTFASTTLEMFAVEL